jgi:endonuclease YncB( thermonuclease family)
MRQMLFLLALWLGILPSLALADFTGRVVRVHDGDTLTVLVARNQIRVRLVDIDAPELGQAFGRNSRQSLAGMCAGKTADVEDTGRDAADR